MKDLTQPEIVNELRADMALLIGLIEAMDILTGEPGPAGRNALYAVIRSAQPLAKAVEAMAEKLDLTDHRLEGK